MVETSRGYGRGILRGIARYADLHGPWEFYLNPGDFKQSLPNMKQWKGDGIIIRVPDAETLQRILKTGLPAVALDIPMKYRLSINDYPCLGEVRSGSEEAVKMAADHFIERQFQRFAYVGNYGQVWSTVRENTFRTYLEGGGYHVDIYDVPHRGRIQWPWETEQSRLIQWLSELPKPVALLACNDQRGREVLEACRNANIAVPDEVSVVGIDNDELLCELSNPSMSSIALDTERGGYMAAEMLDQMMQRRFCGPKTITVEPLKVVVRRSSDSTAVNDPDIAEVMHLIHDRLGKPVTVGELTRHVQLSKRNLQKRFRKVMGRTLNTEIRNTQLERCRALLQDTDMSIAEIATVTGFETTSYLIQCFRKKYAMTPLKYRQTFRKESGKYM